MLNDDTLCWLFEVLLLCSLSASRIILSLSFRGTRLFAESSYPLALVKATVVCLLRLFGLSFSLELEVFEGFIVDDLLK